MKKPAFTLFEFIFVILILAIVAGASFLQVSTVYENMMQKQASGELETKTNAVAEQIAVRISSAIKESLVAMSDTSGAECKPLHDTALNAQTNYILAWVGRSDESSLGIWDNNISDYRGWSGFVDVNISDNTKIYTKGSKLDNVENVINELTGTTNSLSQGVNSKAAIYFKEDTLSLQSAQTCSDFGLDGAVSPKKLFIVSKGGVDILNLESNPSKISEQYALSHSAYAIERNATDNTLWLRSFRPWNAEHPSNDTTPALLGKDITGFGFKYDGGLFRINVCASKKISSDYNITVCKEKVIF
ncbi:MAG TPA: hypothetical protein PLV58_11285 [Campylobacterales bacterium]|nr:hypothetical protein [Campylobacterales bacterium]